MKREERKHTMQARSKDAVNALALPSEDAIRRVLEKIERSSEERFDSVRTPEAIKRVSQATMAFQASRELTVTVTHSAEDIPDISKDSRFKYSRPWGDGVLLACSQRIIDGERIVVALVHEEDSLLAYGIAVTREAECKIEILDVDYYSRREAGLKETLRISGGDFEVGVAHVVVAALMKACSRPLNVDATTPQSRYVFKSLGFTHDQKSKNPCILRME